MTYKWYLSPNVDWPVLAEVPEMSGFFFSSPTSILSSYVDRSTVLIVTDIKECDDPRLSRCSKDAICEDTPPGNWTCTCKPGYTGDGFICSGEMVRMRGKGLGRG